MSLEPDNGKKKRKPMKKMLRNGVTYAFTMTFADPFQYFSSLDRMEKLVKTTKKVCNILGNLCDHYELHPEFSTPSEVYKCRSTRYLKESTGPRWHFHGTIRFDSVINFYIIGFNKLLKFGIFEIDTIADDYWERYATKDADLMTPLIKFYKLDKILSLERALRHNPFNSMTIPFPARVERGQGPPGGVRSKNDDRRAKRANSQSVVADVIRLTRKQRRRKKH